MVFLGWDPRFGRYATISYYPIYRCLPPLKAPGAATITGKLRRINIGIRKSTAKATKSTPICSGSTGPDLESLPPQTTEYTTAGSSAASLLLLLLSPVTTPPQQLGLELLLHLALPNLFYLSLEVGLLSKDPVLSLNQVIHWAVKPSSLLGLIDPFQEDSSKTLDLVNSKDSIRKMRGRQAFWHT